MPRLSPLSQLIWSPGSSRGRRAAGASFKPHCEALEARRLPSTVTTLMDNVPGSLRDAIATTPAGGTVDFAPGLSGTITLAGGSLIIDKDLTIAGPGADTVTVSGNHLYRVINVYTGDHVAISDLTVAQGEALQGSGLFNDGQLSLTRVVVSQNELDTSYGTNGGGILNTADLTVTDSSISENGAPMFSSGGYGGGIYNAGSLTLIRTTITGNDLGVRSGYGAGLYNVGSASLNGCTVSQNHAEKGGAGIDSESGSLSLLGSTVAGNFVGGDTGAEGQGAGIRNSGGSLTIMDSTISGNTVNGPGDGYGLGIYNMGQLDLTRTTITLNGTTFTLSEGGGIYNTGTAALTACSISQNQIGEQGGGIFNVGAMSLTDCTVANNAAHNGEDLVYEYGGGVAGSVTAIRCTFSGNHSDAYGGAIWGGGTFIDCTFTGNSAVRDGGAVFGSGTFINCTISGNSVAGYYDGAGGAFYSSGVILHNTIVAKNLAGLGSGPDIMGTVAEATFSLIGDGSGSSGVVNGVDGNQVGTADQPIDPLLGALQDNGGPTWTEALLPGSPAIDAGDNASAPGTDQRGFNRIINGTVDIGAYEYQPPDTTTTLHGRPDPSRLGQPVTFRSQVAGLAPGSNTPSGMVTFFDDGTPLGSVALVNGRAAFTTTDLTPGTHEITASYGGFTLGDYQFAPSTSPVWEQVVLPDMVSPPIVSSVSAAPVNSPGIDPNVVNGAGNRGPGDGQTDQAMAANSQTLAGSYSEVLDTIKPAAARPPDQAAASAGWEVDGLAADLPGGF